MTPERENGAAMLSARLGDAMEKTARGEVAVLPFLTPAQRKQAERELRIRGAWEAAWFFGGYGGAERTCLFLLPDYLTAFLEKLPSSCEEGEILALIEEEAAHAVAAVRISGSGFRKLSHRDYLGAILGLGLSRDALGDLAVQNEHEAVLFCPRTLASFLVESLSKVGSDTVKCRLYTPDESFTDGRVYAPISSTVASARLDCVVASLTGLSRESAQGAIRSGSVEVDFEPSERVDLTLTPPVTLSVRGYGRFILRAFDGETKKGRLRLRADKLV